MAVQPAVLAVGAVPEVEERCSCRRRRRFWLWSTTMTRR
jgi:hypothetical protein